MLEYYETMPKQIFFDHCGGPEVLKCVDTPVQDPGPGCVRIRNCAIGINMIDTYYRSGLYKTQLPSGLGQEAAGEVHAIGENVKDFKIGDRVVFLGHLVGYAEYSIVPENRIIHIPANISYEVAAASLAKGLTAFYLVNDTYKVKETDVVLVYAAAGGVGQLLVQLASQRGARVIAIASSDEKLAIAKGLGAWATINSRTENIAQRVFELTNGAKANVAYDSVGRDTFEASLDSLACRGLLVSYGNASGPVTNVDLGTLCAKGSLYVTRPMLKDYLGATRNDLQLLADKLYAAFSQGLKIMVSKKYKLSEIEQAHRDLESRKTVGCILLIPD